MTNCKDIAEEAAINFKAVADEPAIAEEDYTWCHVTCNQLPSLQSFVADSPRTWPPMEALPRAHVCMYVM